jgi:hypothetical protein
LRPEELAIEVRITRDALKSGTLALDVLVPSTPQLALENRTKNSHDAPPSIPNTTNLHRIVRTGQHLARRFASMVVDR